MKFNQIVKNIKRGLNKHSTEILIGSGIVCGISAVVLAVKETPKAMALIEQAEEEKGDNLTKIEVVKTCWTCYIPTALSLTASIACIVGANGVNKQRNAALATACQISETAFREYKNKVVEVIGEEKEKEVTKKYNEERLSNKTKTTGSPVIIAGEGQQLYFDDWSGRPFLNTPKDMELAVTELNRRLKVSDYFSLNEWFDLTNQDPLPYGMEYGWNIIDGVFDLEYSPIMTPDGRTAIQVTFNRRPSTEYDRYSG